MPRTSPAAEHRRVSRDRSVGLLWGTRWSILGPALGSALMLWLAFPPCGCWPLAWLAPLGWLRLISRPHLNGSRPYAQLYAVGIIHWLLMIQWIRLPHWSAWLGWWALSAYLGLYLPLFIGTTRRLVHRWGLSIVWAAPITWTGLELIRAHLLTGFSMSLLGHSQLSWLALVQVADLTGAYGVSFLVMLVAASLERVATLPDRQVARVWPLSVAIVAILVCWGYGTLRLGSDSPSTADREFKVALIQGVYDTQFDGDTRRPVEAFYSYVHLSQQAVAQTPDLHLVVWPESMFTANTPMLTFDRPLPSIPEWTGSPQQLQQRLESLAENVQAKAKWTAEQVGVPLLVGTGWEHLRQTQTLRYNSAVLIDRQGRMVARYDKMHPVMFGEYVPFGRWLPWLYRLTPMPGGLTAGTAPRALDVEGLRVCPSICFENTVPHLIRRQVLELRARSAAPDVLVTITNDGWFWGSSLLDVHLVCGAFRAIETRLPLLIAANTGFSAWIDSNGRVRSQGPRRQEGIVVAKVTPVARSSLYLGWGDWFAGLCLLTVGAAWAQQGFGGWRRFSRRVLPKSPIPPEFVDSPKSA